MVVPIWYEINNFILNGVIFATFLVCVIRWKKIKTYQCLKAFPMYFLLSFSSAVISLYYKEETRHFSINIFPLIEIIFFYNFFRYVLKRFEIILIILFVLFLMITIIGLTLFQDKYSGSIYLLIKNRAMFEFFFIENIFLVIPVLFYYKSIFSVPYLKNLSKDPIFLIMTGIIFCFAISIPVMGFIRTIYHQNKLAAVYLYTINSIGYVIMHFFFIKAFINLKANVWNDSCHIYLILFPIDLFAISNPENVW